jgi:hypothetical protein
MITKEKLIADPTIAYDGDSVIAHMRDGAGNSLTSTGGSLNANITNTVTVSATDLDIRDLSFATDSVDVSGSSVSITGTVAVTQSTSPWVVQTATEYAEDSAHVSGDLGQFMLAVRNDANTSLVSADGDYAPLQVDDLGRLKVSGTFSLEGQYAEDSAHTTGDVGIYNLSVRADQPLVSTSVTGDYASQTVDSYNRSWVNTGANIAISNGAASVTTTSALLVAAAAGRRTILIQNLGNKAMFIGASGVSTSNGVRVAFGGNTQLEIGPNLPLHAVAESGTLDVRWLQLA